MNFTGMGEGCASLHQVFQGNKLEKVVLDLQK